MDTITQAFWQSYESGLLLDEIMHGLLGIVFGLLFWLKTKNLKLSLVPVAVVYLIDFDHLIDYWIYYGIHFNLADFLKGEYFEATGRALVLFHAFEWLAIIVYMAYMKGWESLEAALAFGITAHLLWDVKTVGSILFYSFFYRALNGFIIP